ncbi:YciI family protein [Allohahella sp. A8]|uniref:YciI family protein n=1 Tax=Allohahella sp. A8 TaxID=3141461 RepID=UPI003A807E76
MKVMIIVKATASSEAGEMPDPALMEAMGKYNEELVKAGIMQAGEGLKPSKEGFRVRFDGDSREVNRGPFPATSELIAGFWIWEVKNLEHAIEWVKRCPNPMPESSEIEIRPFFEMSDFEEIPDTADTLEKEDEMRQQLALREAQTNTYLFLGNRTEEALKYYEQHLGAVIHTMMRFSESPDPIPEGALPPGAENGIMHAEFSVGTTRLFASDGCGDAANPAGFSIAFTVANVELAKTAFDALADGGEVTMPLQETFWSPLYGQVKDRFGLPWMVMVEGEQ